VKYKSIMVAALAAVLAAACGERESAPDALQAKLEDGRIVFQQGSLQLKSFATEPVRAGERQKLRLPGRLVWNEERTVRLFPAFGGRVTHILVKPGDAVAQGQPLAVLASPDFGQVQSDARRAQSDFALAEKNLNRLRELNAAGVASRKELSATEADYARAETELARAGNRVKLYGGSDQSLDQNLALASPIAGVVVERNINPGQELRPDMQLGNSPAMFVITDPSRLWVQLDATESQLSSLKLGQIVTLRSGAWPGETFRATVDTISDFIDPATRTVKLRASLDNGKRKLKGEMFVAAELEAPSRAGLQVPSKAVILMGERNYAFVEEAPGRFARVEVKANGEHDGVIGILAGLTEGQKVVVEGNLLLHRLYRQLSSGTPD
jgi:membrane fusion protein, heavy metal efflux system